MSDTSGMMLRVKTEKLVTVAGEVENEIQAMKNKFDAIGQIVNGSNSYWEGEGQTTYILAYRKKCEAIENALNNFRSNVENLRIIANSYVVTESAIEEEIRTLSSDVII